MEEALGSSRRCSPRSSRASRESTTGSRTRSIPRDPSSRADRRFPHRWWWRAAERRIAAKYADMTHWFPIGLDALKHKTEVLERYCEEIGRDPSTIERTMGAPVFVVGSDDEATAFLEMVPPERRPFVDIGGGTRPRRPCGHISKPASPASRSTTPTTGRPSRSSASARSWRSSRASHEHRPTQAAEREPEDGSGRPWYGQRVRSQFVPRFKGDRAPALNRNEE